MTTVRVLLLYHNFGLKGFAFSVLLIKLWKMEGSEATSNSKKMCPITENNVLQSLMTCLTYDLTCSDT